MDFHQGILAFVIGDRTGIQKWVSDKSMGCEVRIDLPKKWYKDDNFLGFSLFFNFVHLPPPHDDQTRCNIPHCCCEFSISQCHQSIPVSSLWSDFNFINYCDEGLEAMGVSFFPQIGLLNEYRSRRWKHFKASFDYKPFNGKSCGMHPIYAPAKDQDDDKKRSRND